MGGLNFLRGILLSIPLAGFVALFYLPGVDGFPLLCLGLGVPLFFASLRHCITLMTMIHPAGSSQVKRTIPARTPITSAVE